MEENKNNEEKIVDTEGLKKETVDTVNQVKDTFKNVDIKNDTKEATGFVSAMFKDPFAKIREIATDSQNKNLKTAIIFLVIWMLIEFFIALVTTVSFKYWSGNIFFSRIWSIIKVTIAPLLSILVLAVIVFVMNKKSKKSLLTTITSITIAKIPQVIATIVSLLTLISIDASKLTNRFSSFCYVISTVLVYFSLKSIFEEEQNSKFFKTFVIIEGIFYIVAVLFSLILGIVI